MEVLVALLEAVRDVLGDPRAVVSLFDYPFNEVHVLRDDISRHLEVEADVEVATSAISLFNPYVTPNASYSLTFSLLAGGQKFGVLCVVTANPGFPQDCHDVLQSLANLAALALERCDHQRVLLQEWLPAFSSVAHSGQTSADNEGNQSLLREIATSAMRISQGDLMVLYEYFAERDDIRLPPTIVGVLHHPDVLLGRGRATNHRDSAVFRLLEHGAAVYAEDAVEDWARLLNINSTNVESFLSREAIVSSLGIPLEIDNERVGALFINYRTARRFSLPFKRHLELFAKQAALALGNSRSFSRFGEASAEVEPGHTAIPDSGKATRQSRAAAALEFVRGDYNSLASRDIGEIGSLIDELVRQVIPTDNFMLCIYDSASDRFTLPYLRDEYDSEKRKELESGAPLGVTAYVCRTGKALLATGVELAKLVAEGKAQLVGKPAAVWLGAPMAVGEGIIGALVVQDYHDEERLSRNHLRLLKGIAAQAAIAIDKSRLLRDRDARVDELSALLELAQDFSTRSLTSSELLSSVLDRVCRLAGDGSLLLLLDTSRQDRLRVAATSTNLLSYLNKTITIGQGLAGRVAENATAAIQNNYDTWEGRADLFDPAPRHVCAVPVCWEDRLIGVLTLSRDSAEFSQREIQILQRFAGPAAVALKNARDASFRRALIESSPDGIIASDPKGRITEVNEAAATLLEYPRRELIGQSVTKLYWGGYSEAKKIGELLDRHGHVRDHEVFGITAKGEKVPVMLTAAILRDDSQELLGSVGILTDLRLQSLQTRVQLLVAALRDISISENLEEIVVQVVDSACALLYADAGALFLATSEGFQTAATVPKDELLDELFGILNARFARSPAGEAFSTVFLGAAEVVGLGRRDARSAVLQPIQAEDKLFAVLLVESCNPNHFTFDLDLLALLASQAAVSINRVQLLRYREKIEQDLLVKGNAIMVGQIATSFVHEARNALNTMSLVTRNVYEELGGAVDLQEKSSYLKRLDMVQGEIGRFDNLAWRLQRFTKQGLRPIPKAVHLNPLVSRTIQLLGSNLREKRMKIEERLDSSLNEPASGSGNPLFIDEDQIQQVLMNLILNGIAASEERQVLHVETKAREEFAVIRITDFGKGITAEDRRRLFTPFFSTRPGGTGLGLYLSRLLVVQNHAGSIEIESSNPGKGSTVAIRLPWPHRRNRGRVE